jgi:hypothetical protein
MFLVHVGDVVPAFWAVVEMIVTIISRRLATRVEPCPVVAEHGLFLASPLRLSPFADGRTASTPEP